MWIDLAGHRLEFSDCREVVGSGPEACSLSIDGNLIDRSRFDPSPLNHNGSILIPVRKIGFFASGYALARIEPVQRKLSVISKVHGYMRLLRIEGDAVFFAKTTYNDDEGRIALR
jgi:hypothetical protein